MNWKQGLSKVIMCVFFLFLIGLTIYPAKIYELIDYAVFIGSARNLLAGIDIYSVFGGHALPFWYFPWLTLLFIPFTVFPLALGQVVFTLLNTLVGFYSLKKLVAETGTDNFYLVTGLFSLVLCMGWLVFSVGQITYLLLGTCVLCIVLIKRDKKGLAGCLVPVLILKPHLFIFFLPAMLLVGGRKFFLSGTVSTLGCVGIAFLIQPDWLVRMYTLLTGGVFRVDVDVPFQFTTLAALLGFDQNYLGTANLPITAALLLVSGFLLWKIRKLPLSAFLSMALAFSLLCAPRSYAYDLPLLVPALVWLSEKWSRKTFLLWLAAAIIPLVALYSSGAYLLVVLVCGLGVYKGLKFLTDQKKSVVSSQKA